MEKSTPRSQSGNILGTPWKRCGSPRAAIDSSSTPYQGKFHSRNHSATGRNPVQANTGKLVAGSETKSHAQSLLFPPCLTSSAHSIRVSNPTPQLFLSHGDDHSVGTHYLVTFCPTAEPQLPASGAYALFTEQGSSASQTVSANTEVKMEEFQSPDFWIRLPRHEWSKSWRNIEDLLVLLERKLYGLLASCGKDNSQKLFRPTSAEKALLQAVKNLDATAAVAKEWE